MARCLASDPEPEFLISVSVGYSAMARCLASDPEPEFFSFNWNCFDFDNFWHYQVIRNLGHFSFLTETARLYQFLIFLSYQKYGTNLGHFSLTISDISKLSEIWDLFGTFFDWSTLTISDISELSEIWDKSGTLFFWQFLTLSSGQKFGTNLGRFSFDWNCLTLTISDIIKRSEIWDKFGTLFFRLNFDNFWHYQAVINNGTNMGQII